MVKAKCTASQDWVRQAIKLAEDQVELDGMGFEELFESCSSLEELRLKVEAMGRCTEFNIWFNEQDLAEWIIPVSDDSMPEYSGAYYGPMAIVSDMIKEGVFSSRELDDLLVDIMSKYNGYMIERSSKQFSDLKRLMALIIRKSEEEEK